MSTENEVRAEPERQHGEAGYVGAVMQAVEDKKIKPRCVDCGSIGWASFNLIGMPTIVPVLGGGGIYEATFNCLTCGCTKSYNLQLLGVNVHREESRIVDASGQPAGSGLVIPG